MKKIWGIVLGIILILIGLRFGILGALLGATGAAWSLKRYGVVSKDSAWVTETKGMKKAKYTLLSVVLGVIVIGIAYVYFSQ